MSIGNAATNQFRDEYPLRCQFPSNFLASTEYLSKQHLALHLFCIFSNSLAASSIILSAISLQALVILSTVLLYAVFVCSLTP